MRGRSHAAMGHYLLREYMPGLPRRYARAFLIGCIQPDRNPTTYLKGSLRSQWLRGHNYCNASRFIRRLAIRLENRSSFSLMDYYSLGKLMHYTMDAFTYPHNENFPRNLPAHRDYEIRLQVYFLSYLHMCQRPETEFDGSAASLIRRKHAEYMRMESSLQKDAAFAFVTCCLLAAKLTPVGQKCQEYQFQSGGENAIIVKN